MNQFSFLEKYTFIILLAIIGISLTSFFHTPMIINLEFENIFNSFLINESTNNLITNNLEATAVPPLFYWLKHLFFNVFGFNLSLVKILPALTLTALIIICYNFTKKYSTSNMLGLLICTLIATSPFFIVASKIITLDLLYVLLYATASFICISNVYGIKYNNFATIIAGIITATCFSLTGFIGVIPIIFNYLAINFIRGGFLLNLKFNNPLFFMLGFVMFIALWISALAKNLGYSEALTLLFDYHSVEGLANITFDTKSFFRYSYLFIIGGFPWIAILPSALWQTIKNSFRGLNSSNIYTSLPLIQLTNILFLIVLFSTVNDNFYILLTIYFNMIIIMSIKINSLTESKLSWVNIIPAAVTMIVMGLFLNEFLNIDITSYKFDSTVKEIIVNSNTSISEIPNSIFYLISGIYLTSVLSLIGFGILNKNKLLIVSILFTVTNFGIFSFFIFPNVTNKRFMEYKSEISWASHYLEKDSELAFYKIKNSAIASKGKESNYFDDVTKMQRHLANSKKNITIVFSKSDRRLINRLKKSSRSVCRKSVCLKKI